MRGKRSELMNISIKGNETIKSPFDITVEDVRLATIKFEKEGSGVMVGNRKGIAGISLLKNKYHRARVHAIQMVTACKR